jgi:hypothetical protein
MPRPVIPSDLREDAIWLLSLSWAGRTWRVATKPVVVSSDSPLGTDTYQYEGGLGDLDVEHALAVFADSPDERSVSLDLILSDVDVAAVVQDGHDLAAATGELALWLDGTTYEERLVVVRGRVSQPEYGAEGEPISFSLVEEPYDDVARFPASGMVVNSTTWPDAAEDAVGATYPTVFGAPGVWKNASGTAQNTPGSPALCVDYDATNFAQKLLIAWHPCQASQVRVWFPVDGADGTVEGPFTITYEVDGLGQRCAVLDVSAATADLRGAGEWWIVWYDGDAMISPFRAGAGLTTAGEMLRYMADMSSLTWNRGKLIAASGFLQSRIDGYIDEHVSPWEWVQDNILPLLPASVASDEQGLFVVVWRHDANATDAIDHLEAGPGINRVGLVSYDRKPREIVSGWTVSYALNSATNEYQKRLILTADVDLDDPETYSSAHARSSYLRYGSKRADVIETDIVYSDATAAYVANWHIMAHGFAARLVTYEMALDRGWWDLGDVVTLTDDELALDEVVALVQAIRLSDVGVIEVTLQILDDVETRGVTLGTSLTWPSWPTGN